MNPNDNQPQAPTPEQPIPAEQPSAPQPYVSEQPSSEIPQPSSFAESVDTSQAEQPNGQMTQEQATSPMSQPALDQSNVAATSFSQSPLPSSAPAPANPSKKMAVASLVLGIIGFLTGFLGIGILLGLVAVILGIVSLVKHHGGKGMAITGLVFGAIAFFLGPIALLITLGTVAGIQHKAEVEQQESQLRIQQQREFQQQELAP